MPPDAHSHPLLPVTQLADPHVEVENSVNASQDPGAQISPLATAKRNARKANALNSASKSSPKPLEEITAGLSPNLRTNPPVLMNERELSQVTGLCPRNIRNLVNDGIIPRIKIGRRVLFRWPQVEAALAKLETRGRAS